VCEREEKKKVEAEQKKVTAERSTLHAREKKWITASHARTHGRTHSMTKAVCLRQTNHVRQKIWMIAFNGPRKDFSRRRRLHQAPP
jgi:hypothetical protein